jgi:hypothetical protein
MKDKNMKRTKKRDIIEGQNQYYKCSKQLLPPLKPLSVAFGSGLKYSFGNGI